MTIASTHLKNQRQFAPSQLTGGQLASLRATLTQALAVQRARFEQSEALASTLTIDPDDDVGRSTEMTRLAADRARDAMVDVEHALGRFDDGTNGTCEACSRPIPFERLEAVPHARHCLACPRPGGLIR
jgi:RNA polymerase-binding transcription factor DksA